MDYSVIEGFSSKELEMFKLVCNKLLAQTFIVRTNYQEDKGITNNPEYTFITRYYDTVKGYLTLLDWELHQEENYGYYFVLNTQETNRRSFNRNTTLILLTLRILYDENNERAGLYQDVLCTMGDLMEKLVTVFGVISRKPNMEDIKHSMRLLEGHCIVRSIHGKYTQMDCAFTILPTIQTAVSSEKVTAIVKEIKESEEAVDEETDESSAD